MEAPPITWLALAALAINVFIRLIKADTMNALLAKFSIPAIPKKALPWIALALGFASLMVKAKVDGATWEAALLAGVAGLFSGGGAIALHEALSPPVRAVSEPAANVLFGAPSSKPPANDNGVQNAA